MRWILLFILNISVAWGQCPARSEVSAEQFQTIKTAFEIGAPHDLSYSLAAIVWKESAAGKWLVNVDEHSYGPFQIYLKTAKARMEFESGELTPFQVNMLASNLLNIKYSSNFAVAELEFWKGVHGRSWRNIYASYNGGWSYTKPRPQAYSQDIITKISKLKGCFSD